MIHNDESCVMLLDRAGDRLDGSGAEQRRRRGTLDRRYAAVHHVERYCLRQPYRFVQAGFRRSLA
jgi:hypothetical protein